MASKFLIYLQWTKSRESLKQPTMNRLQVAVMNAIHVMMRMLISHHMMIRRVRSTTSKWLESASKIE